MHNITVEKTCAVVRPQCGTRAGHIQHYKKNEEYCEPCVQANRAYQKGFRKRHAVPIEERIPPTVRKQCGTARGVDFHYYHGEQACEPCKEAGNLRHKERYDVATPEQKWSRNTKWRVENPDLYKKSDKKWRENNSEKISVKNRRQRAVKASAVTEPYTSEQVIALYGDLCHICEEKVNLDAPRSAAGGAGWELGLQVDHVVPLSKGGTDLLENVRPSHGKCNLLKGNRSD
jgi:5-methylcytosine-specific restriction endonuclease McrA